MGTVGAATRKGARDLPAHTHTHITPSHRRQPNPTYTTSSTPRVHTHPLHTHTNTHTHSQKKHPTDVDHHIEYTSDCGDKANPGLAPHLSMLEARVFEASRHPRYKVPTNYKYEHPSKDEESKAMGKSLDNGDPPARVREAKRSEHSTIYGLCGVVCGVWCSFERRRNVVWLQCVVCT